MHEHASPMNRFIDTPADLPLNAGEAVRRHSAGIALSETALEDE